MKFIKQVIVVTWVMTSFISCEKNEDNLNVVLNKEAISAKWIVDEPIDYVSFEYNESGNYIIVRNMNTKSTNNQIVLFGTYNLIDDKTITLSDFGTMKISNIEENSIDFSISLYSDPNSETSISAVKQDEIANSTKTKLLCKTWELVSLGESNLSGFTILLSNAGTYFVKSVSDGDEGTLGTWKWCNSEETKLAFTIDNILDCDGTQIIKDIVLTTDSFTGIDMENGQPEVMIMKSIASVKSTRETRHEINKKILGKTY